MGQGFVMAGNATCISALAEEARSNRSAKSDRRWFGHCWTSGDQVVTHSDASRHGTVAANGRLCGGTDHSLYAWRLRVIVARHESGWT